MGESVVCEAFPNDFVIRDLIPKKITPGTVNEVIGDFVFYDNIDTEDGNSGAGIFNDMGYLVGVHSRSGCDDWDTVPGNHGNHTAALVEADLVIAALADFDCDDDGWDYDEDNCDLVPNADQNNCDKDDGDEWGDACDDDYCAYFCGAGVHSVVSHPSGSSYSAGVFTFYKTPSSEIETEYCAVGPADAPEPLEEHDAEIFWCDCGDEDSLQCRLSNCERDPYEDHDVVFHHGDWHMISYRTGSHGIPAPNPDLDPPASVDEGALWYPSSDCGRDTTWSTWG